MDTAVAALISSTIALIVALTAGAFQFRQARRQHQHGFERSLFEARLAAYPELYSLLSGYAKAILYGSHSRESLREFRDKIDRWNNEHSLLFAPSTSSLSWRFRAYLKVVLDDRPQEEIEDRQWLIIRKTIGTLEGCLRSEIGIYDTSPVGEAPSLLPYAERALDDELS